MRDRMDGQGLLEYGLITSIIAAAVAATVALVGAGVLQLLNDALAAMP